MGVSILAFALFFAFVYLVWRHETDPNTKHNPPDPEHLKCKPTQGAGKGL